MFSGGGGGGAGGSYRQQQQQQASPYFAFGQPQQSSRQQQTGLASKLAQAGTGLYELVNQMRRNNIGAKDVGYGIGSAISGVFGAPAKIASGIKQWFGF